MRLDAYLAANGYAKSRTQAKEIIEAGRVTVNGAFAVKPALEVDNPHIEITGENMPYVSRGGLKLAAALDVFGVEPDGAACIDVGASTGGFTDCLLQRGAASVLAIDCGHGQLAPYVAADPRVTSLEGFNARELSPGNAGSGFTLAVMDVSFISQTLIHAPLAGVLAPGAHFVTLVKPQFEAGRECLSGKGIVKNEADRLMAVLRVTMSAQENGFEHMGTIESPITGGDGNIEYLLHFIYTGGK